MYDELDNFDKKMLQYQKKGFNRFELDKVLIHAQGNTNKYL